ncbi:uncharacterized protein LOC120147501 [Hibiscus syriacus]|uniref:uncharacterized protein LOC120147501 n=1 Tax=Hibiscus syriacus TaxID=106335 RepID=UPI001921ACE1|nr:uncharacterized protein LOC120147501 [Hibiscus syriacus]
MGLGNSSLLKNEKHMLLSNKTLFLFLSLPLTLSECTSRSLTINLDCLKVDGMLNEAEIPKVTKALEGAEGVSNLKVQVLEGISTVETSVLFTTVQATGVASNLVELIQGAGFKLQTLNLSFDDEEDILV